MLIKEYWMQTVLLSCCWSDCCVTSDCFAGFLTLEKNISCCNNEAIVQQWKCANCVPHSHTQGSNKGVDLGLLTGRWQKYLRRKASCRLRKTGWNSSPFSWQGLHGLSPGSVRIHCGRYHDASHHLGVRHSHSWTQEVNAWPSTLYPQQHSPGTEGPANQGEGTHLLKTNLVLMYPTSLNLKIGDRSQLAVAWISFSERWSRPLSQVSMRRQRLRFPKLELCQACLKMAAVWLRPSSIAHNWLCHSRQPSHLQTDASSLENKPWLVLCTLHVCSTCHWTTLAEKGSILGTKRNGLQFQNMFIFHYGPYTPIHTELEIKP